MLKKLELLIINELKDGKTPEIITEEVCHLFIKNSIIKDQTEEYFILKESFEEIAHLLRVKHIAATKYR